MKKLLILLAVMLTVTGFSQVPVTDSTGVETKRHFHYETTPNTVTTFRETFSDSPIGETRPIGWNIITPSVWEISEQVTQDGVLKEIDSGTKFLENTSIGAIATQSSTAYGVWEFSVYKDLDANNLHAMMVSGNPGAAKPTYGVSLAGDESVTLYKNIPPFSWIAYTVPNYIELDKWYRIKVTRTMDGEFTIYIKGGSFGDTYTLVDMSGGLGTNPITDNTYTESSWFSANLGPGDRITDIVIKDSDPFVFELAVSASDVITLPLLTGYTYDFVVNWGDGTSSHVTAYNDSRAVHTYGSTGSFAVSVTGKCGSFSTWGKASIQGSLTDISQWGDIGIEYVEFGGCTLLTSVSATDALDMSELTHGEYVFYGCTGLTTIDLSHWDVTPVTSLKGFFQGCSNLALINVADWDMSGILDPSQIFYGCAIETVDVSSWDLSSATTVASIFNGCAALITVDVSSWDVSSATSFINFCHSCTSLTTIDLSGWDTSSGTACNSIFFDCTSLTSTIPANKFWDRAPAWGAFPNAFTNDTNIANYADIPNGWKGL